MTRASPPEDRFYSHMVVMTDNECWPWIAGVNENGYGTINVYGRTTLAHRLSWQMHRGEIPHGKNVLHSCDVPGCVNPAHLFIGTQLDNVQDMERKQRSYHPRGQDHGRAKLTEQEVLEIRSDPRSNRKTAVHYGVSAYVISQIRQRKIWKHI